MQSFVLLGVTLTLFVIYMLMITMEKGKSYFTKKSLLNTLEDKYDSLRKQRREMLQHYYWAQSSNEKEKEKNLENKIFKLDEELEEIRKEYELMKEGKKVPLKKL